MVLKKTPRSPLETEVNGFTTLCYMLHPTTQVSNLLLCELLQCSFLPSRNTTPSQKHYTFPRNTTPPLVCLVSYFVLLCTCVFWALIPKLWYWLQLKQQKKTKKKRNNLHFFSCFTLYIQVLQYPFPKYIYLYIYIYSFFLLRTFLRTFRSHRPQLACCLVVWQ